MTEIQSTPVVRVGNDALKVLIKGIADMAKLGSDVLSGFSIAEVGELLQLGQDVKDVISNVGQIVPQYVDLDDAERADLEAYVASVINVPASVTVQSVLALILDTAINMSSLFKFLATVRLPQAN